LVIGLLYSNLTKDGKDTIFLEKKYLCRIIEQGLRINFFTWASRRGLGSDASKRRNTYAGDSSNR